MHGTVLAVCILLLVACIGTACGGETVTKRPDLKAMTLEEALQPYTGPVEKGVDTSTLYNKVMCGYQGWFMARGDGFQPGFVHWGGMDKTPPRCSVDFWPDVSELDADEKFPTNYRYADGSNACVFSSTVAKSVYRHFRWMKEYGIDGVFVQRFTGCVSNQKDWNYQRTCVVLNHCREGANRYGRAYAVMYDTDFDRRAIDTMKADWTRLIREMKVTSDAAYMRHRGGPVISLWGYGFDHRKFDAAATEEFFAWLKQPENGACTIKLGVPNDWVTWKDDRMRLLEKYATVISPWNVGRYHNDESASRHFERHWPKDLEWCKAHGKDYYAVAFPGFSWTNLQNGASPLNQIPRRGGTFFWNQIKAVKQYGLNMVYVAMFDEVDEGTAIFKCTNNPPIGRFGTYEGLPSDFYLRLTGNAGRFLRGEDVWIPDMKPDPAQMNYKPVPAIEYYKGRSSFAADTIARWKKDFGDMPLVVPPEPYSAWVYDLYNSDALTMRLMDWSQIVDLRKMTAGDRPVLLLASGNEGFNEGGTSVDDIVEALKRYLKDGGTLVVLSTGNYPMFYPGGGRTAEQFGFKLKMTNSPEGSKVVFDPSFSSTLKEWTRRKAGGSRLMQASLYPGATKYQSLARVVLSDGREQGDAVALVQPGGAFGQGRILYVAGDLVDLPQREQLLDAVLRCVSSTSPK